MFGQKNGNELKSAADILSQYDAVDQTISREVEALQAVISELLAAEGELQAAEVAVAMGEQSADATVKPSKRLERARSAIDGAARRLGGLRARLLGIVQAVPAVYAGAVSQLPEASARIKQKFEAEWGPAAAAFARILGRRAAIEALLGEPLSVPEPTSAAVELEPEIEGLHRQVGALKSVIERATKHWPKSGTHREIKPYEVYVMKHESRDFAPGTFVLRCSFPENKLASLVQAEWAVPMRDPAVSAARNAARNAKLEMENVERRRGAAMTEVEDQARAAERKRFLERNYPEQAGGTAPVVGTFIEEMLK